MALPSTVQAMQWFTTFSTYYLLAEGAIGKVIFLVKKFIPEETRQKIGSAFLGLLNCQSDGFRVTLTVREYSGSYVKNSLFEASEIYLRTKVDDPSLKKLLISKENKEKNLIIAPENNQTIIDVYQGIQVSWVLLCVEDQKKDGSKTKVSHYEIKFDKKDKELVLRSYIPYVMQTSEVLTGENRILNLYTRYDRGRWTFVKLDHPSTFETLAMDLSLKKNIKDDLDRFVQRRDYYKRVGKAWKRGYLLYGPPGTGKSSLIAAMANYLKFDVYDLELSSVYSNSELRTLLLATKNRSLLVIEDIDCAASSKSRENNDKDTSDHDNNKDGVTLSGLLNLIDGIWSSCGDERVIVFTTNYKDKLDPALLRPGRMDMHIHMSYCSTQAFGILATNYLGLDGNNRNKLYLEIKDQIENSKVTPAEVAEEMLKCEDIDMALAGVLECVKRKRTEDSGNETPKRQKVDCEDVKGVALT